ncbi:MAG: cupredoxin domain-containing protein [Minisyncoccota bacterium]
MRAVFSVLMLLAAIALIGTFAFARVSSKERIVDLRGQERVAIVLNENGFEPRDIRVTRGTIITFTTTRQYKFWPASNAHPSHDVYPQFDPKRVLGPEESWSFTMDDVGSWGYHDHVRSYFTGIIYVDE